MAWTLIASFLRTQLDRSEAHWIPLISLKPSADGRATWLLAFRVSRDVLVSFAHVRLRCGCFSRMRLRVCRLQTADSDKLVRISSLRWRTAAPECTLLHLLIVLRTRSLLSARMHGIE
jgi:hypothetical protein